MNNRDRASMSFSRAEIEWLDQLLRDVLTAPTIAKTVSNPAYTRVHRKVQSMKANARPKEARVVSIRGAS